MGNPYELAAQRSSRSLVLVIPQLRLPELDLVSVRVHDPRELAVLVRLRSLNDAHARATQLLEQLAEVVDAVVDHEGRLTGVEPLAVFPGDMPHREPSILCRIVRPPQ